MLFLKSGSAVKLNGEGVFGVGVTSFKISPDNQSAVYVADQNTDNVNELYSVGMGGGEPIKLNSVLVSGGEVSTDFDITSTTYSS